MAETLERLKAEVLSLSPSDRARLLDRLIASMEVDAATEAAWDAVADSREAEINSGAVSTIPQVDVIARLEARFCERM